MSEVRALPPSDVVGKILGVGLVMGVSLAAGTLYLLALAGAAGGLGAGPVVGGVVFGALGFTLLVGVVLAALGGAYAGLVLPRRDAPSAGFWGGALGHAGLLVAFTLSFGLGAFLLSGASGSSDLSAPVGETLGFDLATVFKVAFGVLPVGVVGLTAASVFTRGPA